MISVIESPPYSYISYTKSSISTKTGRQEVHRGVKRPMPFIAKHKTRGTASENIGTANHIIPQEKLYSSLLSVYVDYIFFHWNDLFPSKNKIFNKMEKGNLSNPFIFHGHFYLYN